MTEVVYVTDLKSVGQNCPCGFESRSRYKITNILYMFKCECGREFETQRSLNSHARFCSLYKKKKKKVSKYKINENLWRCECGKEFNNCQSLNAHLSHCIFHHECLGTPQKLRPSKINHSINLENKL